MTTDQFTQIALTFPNVITTSHFDRIAFKVIGERIFATLHEETKTANVKFLPADQSVYCLINKEAIYPVNNKWGLQGWTTFNLANVDQELMLDALHTAYQDVFKSKKK
ncbi:MAG: MmcQ/YjbR family DNA-binding protein [Segetibacter sp.]